MMKITNNLYEELLQFFEEKLARGLTEEEKQLLSWAVYKEMNINNIHVI